MKVRSHNCGRPDTPWWLTIASLAVGFEIWPTGQLLFVSGAN